MGPSVTPGMPHSQHAPPIKTEPKDINQNTAKRNLPSVALGLHMELMGAIWGLQRWTIGATKCISP
eukprot:203567-Ditylum_brightwellii.AAC.1